MNTNEMVAVDKVDRLRKQGTNKGISTNEDAMKRARMASRISEFLDFAFYPDSGSNLGQVSMNF